MAPELGLAAHHQHHPTHIANREATMTTTRALDGLRDLATGRVDFITGHALWDEAQIDRAREVLDEVDAAGLESIRVSFADPHGISRSKTLSARAFHSAMRNGIDSSPGPFIFDTGLDLVFNPFEQGGGLNTSEMTGAGDFLLVPDPLTFKVLPWAPSTGWILCDEYFKTGTPVPFSARQLLKRLLAELGDRGLTYVVGLEVEWYLTKMIDPRLTVDAGGGFGSPGQAPLVAPVNLGYQFNIENFNDELDDILQLLRSTMLALDLPLRTTEHESGPGQLEFTFDPIIGIAAADAMILFRTAVKQICARNGYHATFMSAPALAGFDASGWHLHQSIFNNDTGRNEFMTSTPGALVSETATYFAGGLLRHAPATAIFATPTVNGYKRLSERFALSPDRATWSADNRGTYIRVLGDADDPAAHFENRMGEPCANPYLYMASQLIAGMDGIDTKIEPGPMTDNPHDHDLPLLPTNLGQAIDALRTSNLFRRVAGEDFVDFFTRLKDNEWRRYNEALAADGQVDDQSVVTEWEQREYFRVY